MESLLVSKMAAVIVFLELTWFTFWALASKLVFLCLTRIRQWAVRSFDLLCVDSNRNGNDLLFAGDILKVVGVGRDKVEDLS